jgi:ribonuclease P protein component
MPEETPRRIPLAREKQPSPKAGLSKDSRLRSNSDFRSVMAGRRRLSDGLLAIYFAPNGRQASRLGVSVGRATGNAVRRNRLKRLIREVWRLRHSAMPHGIDLVVMPAKKTLLRLPTYQEVDASLVALMARLGADKVGQ